jgi:hypothetical protein
VVKIDPKGEDVKINDFATFYRGYKADHPNATESEISKVWHDMRVSEAQAVGAIRIPAYTTGSGMPPGYVLNRRTGNYEWRGEGPAPGVSPEVAASYKSDASSLANQVKQRDMMKGFVTNMNKQVDRLGTILKDVARYDARLLNVPLRKWRMTVAGSPAESKIAMYVTEISNEIGKISTGSSASIRELSESAQKKWDKIHDPNLTPRDLMSLLNETKHAGEIRVDSSDQIINETKKRLGGGGASGGGGAKDPLNLGL